MKKRVENLDAAPAGFEYRPLFGRQILLPETGKDPLIEGTTFTGRQQAAVDELRLVRDLYPISLFPGYLEKRDKMLIQRSGVGKPL